MALGRENIAGRPGCGITHRRPGQFQNSGSSPLSIAAQASPNRSHEVSSMVACSGFCPRRDPRSMSAMTDTEKPVSSARSAMVKPFDFRHALAFS